MQTYKNHIIKNFNLAYPVMLSQLGHMLVGTADSMMVGQTGATPLAAVSLGTVLFNVIMTFGLGISYGSTPLVGQADGEGDTSRVGSILRHSLLINMVTGIILFLIVLYSSDLLYDLKQPEDVVDLAIPYMQIITFSMIPLMLFQTLRQFLEGLSITRPAMWISLIANALNVLLNYILIFGKMGFEPMGIIGAGWASLISRIIMALIFIAYFIFNKKFKQYRESFLHSIWEKTRFQRILKIGLPAAFQYIIEVSAFGVAVIMMGWIGTNHQAAHQIAINMAAITYMMATGLGAAATIRVSNQLGQRDIQNLKRSKYSLLHMVLVFMSLTALLFIFGKDWLPTLYTDNSEVIEIASSLLIIAAVFQLSDGVQVVAIGALRGLEDTLIPTFYIFLAYMVIGLPIGYLLAFPLGFGGIGVWLGLASGLTVVAITLQYRFYKLVNKLKFNSNA